MSVKQTYIEVDCLKMRRGACVPVYDHVHIPRYIAWLVLRSTFSYCVALGGKKQLLKKGASQARSRDEATIRSVKKRWCIM